MGDDRGRERSRSRSRERGGGGGGGYEGKDDICVYMYMRLFCGCLFFWGHRLLFLWVFFITKHCTHS